MSQGYAKDKTTEVTVNQETQITSLANIELDNYAIQHLLSKILLELQEQTKILKKIYQ